MENVIAEKCIKIFESVVTIDHFKVSKKFMDLALKNIETESEEYNKVSDAWSTLHERINLFN